MRRIGIASPRFGGIDSRVRVATLNAVRALNTEKLRALEDIVVIQSGAELLAVLVPYQTFMGLQSRLAMQPEK